MGQFRKIHFIRYILSADVSYDMDPSDTCRTQNLVISRFVNIFCSHDGHFGREGEGGPPTVVSRSNVRPVPLLGTWGTHGGWAKGLWMAFLT